NYQTLAVRMAGPERAAWRSERQIWPVAGQVAGVLPAHTGSPLGVRSRQRRTGLPARARLDLIVDLIDQSAQLALHPSECVAQLAGPGQRARVVELRRGELQSLRVGPQSTASMPCDGGPSPSGCHVMGGPQRAGASLIAHMGMRPQPARDDACDAPAGQRAARVDRTVLRR